MDELQNRFDELMALDADARSERLAQLASVDPSMAERLRSLLECAIHADAVGFLAAPGAEPETIRTIMPGTVVGKYRLVEEIAEGGMGVVYLARRVDDFSAFAAVKFLSTNFAQRRDRQRFEFERQTLADLRHPNIVRLLDGGTAPDGTPYLVMDYISGPTFDKHIAETPLPLRKRLALYVSICEAIAFAHGCGVIHRDLKPRNVLVDEHNRPIVTDFGLAKLVQDGSSGEPASTAWLAGTPSYMAPEQAGDPNAVLGHHTDIYGLGTILYEMLTGKPPFTGPSTPRILDEVRHRPPVSPRRRNHSIPRNLDTICMKCLEKEPLRRYASVAALLADLRLFLAGKPIAARSAGPIEKLAAAARRNPGTASALGGLVLVLVVGLASVTWLWRGAVQSETAAKANLGFAHEAIRDIYNNAAEKWLINTPKMQITQRDVLAKALDYFERLSAMNPNDTAARAQVAYACYRLSIVERQLGNHDRSVALLQRNIELLSQLERDDPGNAEHTFDIACARRELAMIRHVGDPQGCRESLRVVETGIREAARRRPDRPEYRDALASILVGLGSILMELQRFEEAKATINEAQEISEALLRRFPERTEWAGTLMQGIGAQGLLESMLTSGAAPLEILNRAKPLEPLVSWEIRSQIRQLRAEAYAVAGQLRESAIEWADICKGYFERVRDFPDQRANCYGYCAALRCLADVQYALGDAEAVKTYESCRNALEQNMTASNDRCQLLMLLLFSCPFESLRDSNRAMALYGKRSTPGPRVYRSDTEFAVAYYAGDYRRALAEIPDSGPMTHSRNVWRRLYRCATVARLGNLAEAKSGFAQVEQWLADHEPMNRLHDPLRAHVRTVLQDAAIRVSPNVP